MIFVSAKMSGKKRKHNGYDSVDNDSEAGSSPKHPLLESVSSRFQQNKVERDEKLALLKTKRETEKVHSNYLKQNVVDPQELAKASFAANYWAKKNGIKDTVPSNTNLPSPTGRLSKKKASQKTNRQNNLPVAKNKPSHSSTATSADGPNVSIVSLRNKAGELTHSHVSEPSLQGKYLCPVLYCETEFTSEGSLGHHMNLFQHSPCNPLRLCEDNKLLPDPVCYKCPDCDLEFSTEGLCKEHMDNENHLVFYPPLAITAYLCPQCLYLFKTLQLCLSHMESTKHHSFKFPFTDDETDGDFNLPVALSREFVNDYIKNSRKIAHQVQCLDCDTSILSPAQFRRHQKETNNAHVICALTDKLLADVFITYIKTFSCDKCHRLFDEQPVGDTRHICAGGIVGNIRADLVRTTSEFLKYCAFSLITSLTGRKIGKVKQNLQHNLETRDWEVDEADKEDLSLDLVSPELSNVDKKIKQEIPETQPYNSIKKENITVPGYAGGNLPNTLPPALLKRETTAEPIGQERMEEDNYIPEMLPHSSVKKEDITEVCLNRVKQEVPLPSRSVKEETANVVDQETAAIGSHHGFIKKEIKTEQAPLNRVKEETIPYASVKEECARESMLDRVKMESPSTSSDVVSRENAGCNMVVSEDSDSDIEFMEIDDNVDQIVISDSDSDDLMIVDDQDDIKPDSKITGIKVSPSKKKWKKKKNKKKKVLSKHEAKEQKRLEEETATRAACEKYLKFLSKEEKIKENNPDTRQLPGRKAKAAANHFFERKKRRAVEEIAVLDVKKAEREKAEKLEAERKAIALKADALREELRQKEKTSMKQDVKKGAYGADSKGPTSKQLEYVRAELALTDQDENLVTTENLRNKRNLIFLDLDNFSSFFRVLPHCPPEDMFVWAFYGGNFEVGRKNLNEIYFEMRQRGQVYISDRCGKTKDAADFALVLTVGKMDERLPPSVAFTIVSADKGFCEVERLMHNSSRSARVVNPKQDTDILLPLLRSLVDL